MVATSTLPVTNVVVERTNESLSSDGSGARDFFRRSGVILVLRCPVPLSPGHSQAKTGWAGCVLADKKSSTLNSTQLSVTNESWLRKTPEIALFNCDQWVRCGLLSRSNVRFPSHSLVSDDEDGTGVRKRGMRRIFAEWGSEVGCIQFWNAAIMEAIYQFQWRFTSFLL